MKQMEGWGLRPAAGHRQVEALRPAVAGQTPSQGFDIWVDDVKFIGCSSPIQSSQTIIAP